VCVNEWLKPHVHGASWLMRVHLRDCVHVSCKTHRVNAAKQAEKNSRGNFDRLNFAVSCDLYYAICMKRLSVDPSKWTCASQLALCTSGVHFDKAGHWSRFMFLSLFFSLLPYPHDQRTTHQCLPFTPTSPPTILPWLRQGIAAVMVLTSTGRLLLLYSPKTSCDFFTNRWRW
jgi:hypothetical protein